jgi:hypothetical protein
MVYHAYKCIFIHQRKCAGNEIFPISREELSLTALRLTRGA